MKQGIFPCFFRKIMLFYKLVKSQISFMSLHIIFECFNDRVFERNDFGLGFYYYYIKLSIWSGDTFGYS